MSYALLWIEALLTALLWVATCVACAAHARRRWLSRIAVAFAAFVPFTLFGSIAACTAVLKFSSNLRQNWFGYAFSLCLAYLVLVAVLLYRAGRTTAIAPERSAASWPRWRLALGLFTAAAIATMTLWNMDMEARSQAAGSRNEAGAMLFQVSPPTVVDSRNSALVYQKAFDRLVPEMESLNSPDSPLHPQIPDENNPATASLLKRHELTIKLLHKAATMPDGRFDHDYAHANLLTMLMPELSQSRVAARLLWLDSRYEIARGNADAAIADVNAMFHMSKTVGGMPSLIGALVSIAIDGMATQGLQDVLPIIAKKEQLAGLDVGDESAVSRMMERAIRGEEAFGLNIFAELAASRTNVAELSGMMDSTGTGPHYWSIATPTASLLMRVFLMSDDVAAYRELMGGYRESFAHPYYRIQPGAEPLASRPRRGLITSIIAPALQRSLLVGARAQATRAGAQIAVAMTRYRLDRGNFPASLDLLVPNYLDEIPIDPFDGKPMRLVHKIDRWIVYSVGPDAKDDGGAAYDQQSKKGDIPFVFKFAK